MGWNQQFLVRAYDLKSGNHGRVYGVGVALTKLVNNMIN